MGTLANSEDPAEMLHQGLHCLPRQKQYSEKENAILFENYNLRFLNIYSGFIASNCMGCSIGLTRVKHHKYMRSLQCTKNPISFD